MIRRRLGDGRLGLITQDDHARLAVRMASLLGTSRYQLPEPVDALLAATALHDAGWRVHDREPTLNPAGLPTDVFESPRECAWRVWPGAVSAAAGSGERAELLVSIHVLHLSAFLSGSLGQNSGSDPGDKRRAMFEVNRFQQRQIERQQAVRESLGLSTSVALELGILSQNDLVDGDELDGELLRRERALAGQYRWLAAMDLLSLAACCSEVPQVQTSPVLTRLGDEEWEPLTIRRIGTDVGVRPWPFRVERIDLVVPMRVVRGGTFASEHDLREQYAESKGEAMEVAVVAM